LTGTGRLRNVPAMSKSFLKTGGSGVLAFFLSCGMLATWAVAQAAPPPPEQAVPKRGFHLFGGSTEKPYVETMPKRGFHLFIRPKKKTPEAQWEHVQALDRLGKTRAAANQALALRLFWPNSTEAPRAQLLYARLLERRGHLQEAFDAYQYLLEHYTGRFEFNDVVGRQMLIAKTLMDRKKGQFLFLPGFAAPERAIPLFEKIVASAPEWSGTPEAYYLVGVANERVFEYDKAIEAYFTALNRFPDSEFAEKSAYAQAQCHIQMSNDAPNDNRALATARAACDLFLQRHPDSAQRALIEADLARLRDRQARNAYALARYYDGILHKPDAALIAYRSFVALFPNAEQAPAARLRIEQLNPSPEK
jgi:tetratricopeptide (TPR) repeat protein